MDREEKCVPQQAQTPAPVHTRVCTRAPEIEEQMSLETGKLSAVEWGGVRTF